MKRRLRIKRLLIVLGIISLPFFLYGLGRILPFAWTNVYSPYSTFGIIASGLIWLCGIFLVLSGLALLITGIWLLVLWLSPKDED